MAVLDLLVLLIQEAVEVELGPQALTVLHIMEETEALVCNLL
jgi:hypothetical protein